MIFYMSAINAKDKHPIMKISRATPGDVSPVLFANEKYVKIAPKSRIILPLFLHYQYERFQRWISVLLFFFDFNIFEL